MASFSFCSPRLLISYKLCKLIVIPIHHFGCNLSDSRTTVSLLSNSRLDRGGASSISIPAATSCARTSIISSRSLIRSFRKLAIALSREKRSSAISPLFNPLTYRTNRRSLSSAVTGFHIGNLLGEQKLGLASPREVNSFQGVGGVEYKLLASLNTRSIQCPHYYQIPLDMSRHICSNSEYDAQRTLEGEATNWLVMEA